MAPVPTVKASEAESLWQKVALLVPGIAVAATFVGSAVAMKIAPLAGLLPAETNKEILKAWMAFSALPQLQVVLKPLGFGGEKFMMLVAALHLLVVLLLLLPSGPWGTRLAGLWAMVAMAGAEFCTRQKAFVPPGTPAEFKWIAVGIGSATHGFLFVCGCFLVFGNYHGGLIAMLKDVSELMHFAKVNPKVPSSPTKEQRGRSAQEPEKGSKRDTTPKPMKKSQAGESSPVSPSGRGKKSRA